VTMVMEATKAGHVEISVSASRVVELGKDVRIGWVLQNPIERLGKGGEVKE
jgi:hypothetical protein